jgi:hypothetical protein
VKNWVVIGVMGPFLVQVQNWKSDKEYKSIHFAVEELYFFQNFSRAYSTCIFLKSTLSTASMDKG